ncbi:hypothetical protein DHEL01_v206010 [Diaporthe helianthi]|uniref:Alkyl hydroperoxide reductase subunit C/ Thiol specific antioxidant domain-containing protein n=1 Tax=Diaporthe helianthi TaxID=158607 RepID=A0A2P5HZC8_DIAHE|nr:hypothetical protein DHEL01_v206010 [Diaporthe helianthi]
MFSGLGTKLALKKLGVPKSAMNVGSPFGGANAEPKKLKKNQKGLNTAELDELEGNGWPKWMSVKSLPLTIQPWLSPPPPPVPVAAECPTAGTLAPIDRDGKLVLGNNGRNVLVVFLRCVGCAFAQKTFLALRDLANKTPVTCIAISHSSPAATSKWIDLMGGARKVQVIIDEDRAIYAAWGLGLSSVWYYFNPTTQTAAWKEKGWLGSTVATSIGRKMGMTNNGGMDLGAAAADASEQGEGPGTIMGNKWQQGGAFAVDERGTVLWGGKAERADDMLDFEAGIRALGMRAA